MRFFTVYDILEYYRAEKNEAEEDMYSFFRKYGIRKTQLSFLRTNCSIRSFPNLLAAVSGYTGLSELEINLLLGIIPNNYTEQYFSAIHEISSALEKGPHEDRNKTRALFPCFKTELGQLYNADCVELMRTLQDDSMDLIFADPPFNLKKEYDEGINDNLSMSAYLEWSYNWIDECVRILKPGGALFIYNIPKWCTYYADFLNKRLSFRSWIGVDMKFNLPLSGRLYPAHYALLYYIKGDKPSVFNNQRIPLPTCRHCGGDIKDYGGYKNKMNPLGVNLSDIWSDIYPVRHKGDKNRSYNELSVKMLDRIVSMTTNPGDYVFDPFGGSGTTYIVAELLGRRWVGSELGNCKVIMERFSRIEKDRQLLERTYLEKNHLFPKSVQELRRKNGFWLCEDFENESIDEENRQIDLFSLINSPQNE